MLLTLMAEDRNNYSKYLNSKYLNKYLNKYTYIPLFEPKMASSWDGDDSCKLLSIPYYKMTFLEIRFPTNHRGRKYE